MCMTRRSRRRRRAQKPAITPEMRRRGILRRLHLSDYAASGTTDTVKIRERAIERRYILSTLAEDRVRYPNVDEATIEAALLDELELEFAS